MENSNLQIVQRLLELSNNQLEYSLFPKPCREEYIFLSNTLQYAKTNLKREFDEHFRYCVGNYKSSLEQNEGYGWFHNPEKLVWLKMQINQLSYAIYGERFIQEIRFKDELKRDAYRDLICQIDRTALMTDEELQSHKEECNRISEEVVERILSERKSND